MSKATIKDISTYIRPLLLQTVGFDRMFDDLFATASRSVNGQGYPPFNITKVSKEHSQDVYEITFAVAGFTEDDIDIVVENNHLSVSGTSPVLDEPEGTTVEYIHKGIAERSFSRAFRLAENVEVKDAELSNGILTITLMQMIPEEQQPKTISINRK